MAYALAFAPVQADDPVSSTVSFNREVIRIIQRKCEPCHASGGLAMSLSNYSDARAWGRAIREELVEHRMPPALVARGYGRFESDPSLTAREMATFLTWLDGGMPRGEDADLPPRGGIAGDSVDDVEGGTSLRIPLPAQIVPVGEDLVVRRVSIDAGGAAGRAIARVQVRPGNRRVLRGVLVFAGTGSWIGGWLPWQHAVVPPQPYAFNLPARATIINGAGPHPRDGAPVDAARSFIVELYYRGAESEPAVDRSVIDVSFAPLTATGHIDDVVVEAELAAPRSGQATYRARGSRKLLQPTTIWAIQPVVDASTSSMEVRAERPDGSVEVLLWIPKARADWPLALVMQEPVPLPAGSTVSLVVERDASASEASIPHVTLSVLR